MERIAADTVAARPLVAPSDLLLGEDMVKKINAQPKGGQEWRLELA